MVKFIEIIQASIKKIIRQHTTKLQQTHLLAQLMHAKISSQS